MTFQEMQSKVNDMEGKLTFVEKNLSELKNISTSQLKPLIEQIKGLQAYCDERDVIDTTQLDCKIIAGTTHATAGTESAHPHLLGKTPRFTFLLPTMKSYIYQSKSPDPTNIYLKASENSTTFIALIIY